MDTQKAYKDMTKAERAEHIAACRAASKAKRDAKAAEKAAKHAAYMAEPYHTAKGADNQTSRQARTERLEHDARRAAINDLGYRRAMGLDPEYTAEMDAYEAATEAERAAMDTEPSDL